MVKHLGCLAATDVPGLITILPTLWGGEFPPFDGMDQLERFTGNFLYEYIEVVCNRQRRHSTLGHLSPSEFERNWQNQEEESAAD